MTAMTGFVGSDPDELERLAVLVKAEASKMREVVSSSTWAIRISEWTGSRIDALRGEWSRESRPALLRVADQLEALASELETNARQQRDASVGVMSAQSRYEPYPKPEGVTVTQKTVRRSDPPCSLTSLLSEVG